MSIGEALAQARHESGLSVADVSHQTRIRETIISGIERDDFAPCGGDFYARGHIRAIARAVGVDAAPLVDEYDSLYLQPGVIPTGHRPPQAITEQDEAEDEDEQAGETVTPVTPVAPWEPVVPDHPFTPRHRVTPAEPWLGPGPGPQPGPGAGPGLAPGDTLHGPVTPREPLRPESWTAPAPSAAPEPPAAPSQPAAPHQPFAPGDSTALGGDAMLGDPATPGHPGTPGDATMAGHPTTPVGTPPLGESPPMDDNPPPEYGPSTYLYPSASPEPSPYSGPSPYSEPSPYGEPPGHRRRRMNWSAVLGLALLVVIGVGAYLLASGGHPRQARSAAAAHGASSHPGSHPTPSASHVPSPTPTPSPPPAQPLTPASITAFGPNGPGQGDNPQLAQYALDGNAASPWHSDWYTSPQFGNLQPGTGLLLDMGKTVNVSAAQVAVGNAAGGDIQLRVGSTPALSGLPAVAHGSDSGGTLNLHPTSPSQGRYVLVWFTKLPADTAGTFQASVYSIKVQGSR